jgi:cyclopropane fatty-acyl-phospholipid synthase-like methyltransferase
MGGGGMRLVELRTIFARGWRRMISPDPGMADVHSDLHSQMGEPHTASALTTDAAPAPAESHIESHITADAPPPPSAWSATRLELAEALWGEGFLGPGGATEMLRLAAPLGVSAASTLLLLGVGAGGPARVLAADLGAWVYGFDTEPELVELAARRLHRAGAALAKRASVALWTSRVPKARRHACHHGLAIDALRHATFAEILPGLAEVIRPGGQLVLQELVVQESGADAAMAAWCELERRSMEIPTEADITNCLAALGLDVRVVEDQSARHSQLVLQGWQQMLRGLDGTRPALAQAAMMVAEAEAWMRRLRLMQEGRIRLVRWNAIIPG